MKNISLYPSSWLLTSSHLHTCTHTHAQTKEKHCIEFSIFMYSALYCMLFYIQPFFWVTQNSGKVSPNLEEFFTKLLYSLHFYVWFLKLSRLLLILCTVWSFICDIFKEIFTLFDFKMIAENFNQGCLCNLLSGIVSLFLVLWDLWIFLIGCSLCFI